MLNKYEQFCKMYMEQSKISDVYSYENVNIAERACKIVAENYSYKENEKNYCCYVVSFFFLVRRATQIMHNYDLFRQGTYMNTKSSSIKEEDDYTEFSRNYEAFNNSTDKVQIINLFARAERMIEKAKRLKNVKMSADEKKISENFINDSYIEMYHKLSDLYMAIGELDKSEKYAILGMQKDSLSCIKNLIFFSTEKEDTNQAYKYFEKLKSVNVSSIYANRSKMQLFVYATCMFYRYLKKQGEYVEAQKCILYLEDKLGTLPPELKDELNELNAKLKKVQLVYADEKILVEYFTDKELKMLEDPEKLYIITALQLNDIVQKNRLEIDYSSIVITLGKVIESLLYKIVANKYFEYLKRNINPKELGNDKYFIDANTGNYKYKLDMLEIGIAIRKMTQKIDCDSGSHWVVLKIFEKFLCENKVNKEEILEIVTKLDEFREMRNHMAHKDPFSKENANDCMKNALEDPTKLIKSILNVFSFCFEKE